MKVGMAISEDDMMACCWVLAMVEINRPMPRLVNRNKEALSNSTSALPRNGMPKISSAAVVMSTRSISPTMAAGIILPIISSIGRMGVTINCSMVPISFSRTMAMAVSITVTTIMILAMTPG